MTATPSDVFADRHKVLAALEISDQDAYSEDWTSAQAQYNEANLPFLNAEHERKMAAFMGLPAEIREALDVSRELFVRDPAVRRLAWYCYWQLANADENNVPATHRWPPILLKNKLLPGMFYVHVLVCAVPRILELHARRALPRQITKDTLLDVETWARHYHRQHGEWGMSEVTWFRHHYAGHIFCLGRLQFLPEPFGLDIHAFRNRTHGELMFLAGDGSCFRRDGQYDGANGIRDPQAWTSTYTERNGIATGFPIDPSGRALRRMVSLPTDKWEEVLKKGDPTMTIHIPARGPLDHEACRSSYRQAIEFLPRFCPDFPFNAFTCGSWLMDSQLLDYLPDDAGIRLFMKDFYRLPLPNSSGDSTLRFVFGEKPENIEKAPQRTTLERAIVKHVQDGHHWRTQLGVLLPQDVARGSWNYGQLPAPA